MRIGLVTAAYKPVRNGVTRLVSLYKRYLEEAGHEALIFTFGDQNINIDEGVITSPGIKVGSTGYSISFRFSRKAQEMLNQMDIVHYHHPIMALDLRRRHSIIPTVFTNHTRYDLYAANYLPLPSHAAIRTAEILWPKLVNQCDWIIAPSVRVARKLANLGVTTPVSIIRNGIEFDTDCNSMLRISRAALEIPEEAVTLVYVGRLSPEKNLEQLLDIFEMAHESFAPLYLLIVGNGPLRQALENRVRSSPIEEFIRFSGEVPFKLVPSYLAVADIFATASDSEVHPLTAIEAIAAGLPVVSHYERGFSETIDHGKNGYMGFKSNQETADVIVHLARDPNFREKMGKWSLQKSRSFHISCTVERSIKLYQELLNIKYN